MRLTDTPVNKACLPRCPGSVPRNIKELRAPCLFAEFMRIREKDSWMPCPRVCGQGARVAFQIAGILTR